MCEYGPGCNLLGAAPSKKGAGPGGSKCRWVVSGLRPEQAGESPAPPPGLRGPRGEVTPWGVNDIDTVTLALGRLKVFPLPKAVLLPGSALPLHVFEPRYRAMVAEALEGDRVLSVAMLAPGWEQDYEGRPALRPLAGVGIVEEAEKLPDGRYDLLVRGVARARFLGEHAPDKPFREMKAELAEEAPASDRQQVDLVRRAVLQLTESLPEDLAQALATAAARIPDPGTLCDVVAAAVLDEPEDLQAVLEALDVQARVRKLLGEIGGMLLAAHPSPPDGLLS